MFTFTADQWALLSQATLRPTPPWRVTGGGGVSAAVRAGLPGGGAQRTLRYGPATAGGHPGIGGGGAEEEDKDPSRV